MRTNLNYKGEYLMADWNKLENLSREKINFFKLCNAKKEFVQIQTNASISKEVQRK
jgi:hypothetical protein